MSPEPNTKPDSPPQKTAYQDSKNESMELQGGSSGARSNAEIHDRTGLYISIIALALAGMALGAEINRNSAQAENQRLQDQAIDAKIKAGMAETLASMQQQVADAKATANAGREHARVALDKVEDFRSKLAAKGINIPPLDGH